MRVSTKVTVAESGQKMEGTFSSLLEHNEPRPRNNGHEEIEIQFTMKHTHR